MVGDALIAAVAVTGAIVARAELEFGFGLCGEFISAVVAQIESRENINGEPLLVVGSKTESRTTNDYRPRTSLPRQIQAAVLL